METEFKERFLERYRKYFPDSELPVGFYYSNSAEPEFQAKTPTGHRCIVGDIAKVQKGKPVSFNTQNIGCMGGKRYLGFETGLSPDFEYFLSCGIPGKMEGERYKKSPELVKELMKQKPLEALGDSIIFKRLDQMEENENPLAVIFFAPPDALGGLFTLANFDEPQPYGVIAPFASGCASIVDYPRRELQSSSPRAVLGMFDVSARPCVSWNVLSFSIPWPKFVSMVDNMEESFLITGSWEKVKKRLKKSWISP